MLQRSMPALWLAATLLACGNSQRDPRAFEVRATLVDASGARSTYQASGSLVGSGPGTYCRPDPSSVDAGSGGPCANGSWILATSDGRFTLTIGSDDVRPVDTTDSGAFIPPAVPLGSASSVTLTFDGAPATGTFTLTRTFLYQSLQTQPATLVYEIGGAFQAQAGGATLSNGYVYSSETP
jgi:hypothetical protein